MNRNVRILFKSRRCIKTGRWSSFDVKLVAILIFFRFLPFDKAVSLSWTKSILYRPLDICREMSLNSIFEVGFTSSTSFIIPNVYKVNEMSLYVEYFPFISFNVRVQSLFLTLKFWHLHQLLHRELKLVAFPNVIQQFADVCYDEWNLKVLIHRRRECIYEWHSESQTISLRIKVLAIFDKWVSTPWSCRKRTHRKVCITANIMLNSKN